MSFLTKKQNRIQFKAVETPTAWVVLAIAWKNVNGTIVYSEPKIVRIVQKEGTALSGDTLIKELEFLLEGGKLVIEFGEFIPSPYSFSFVLKRTGFIAKTGARAPTLSSRF